MNLPSPLDWLDERFEFRDTLSAVARNLRKPVPKHGNVLYTLGSFALFLFVLQAVTGILMMVYYKPIVRDAYDSVFFIHDDVPFGWLVRQIHVWGANLMVLTVLVHMGKTFFYGSYKKPRELTWMFGCVLLGIVIGFGFTGYLLPWDQLAFWATTVGTEAPGSLPVFGPLVRDLMRGQTEVGQATLGRFFVVHVAVLPVLFVASVGVHLLLVRIQGTAPLSRTDEPEPSHDDIAAAGGKPFYPNHVLKEGAVAYVGLGLLLTLAICYPLMPGEPADPFSTPPGIKPEWYFLPMFQLLKYLPEPVAVALPGFVGALIFALPFIDRSPERRPGKRRLALTVAGFFLVVTAALSILGALSETQRDVFGVTYHFDTKGWPTRVHEAPE